MNTSAFLTPKTNLNLFIVRQPPPPLLEYEIQDNIKRILKNTSNEVI